MDEDAFEENIAQQERHLQQVWECLADVQIDDSPSFLSNYGVEPEYNELSFDSLVCLREKHQTYHAAHSVRTQPRCNSTKEEDSESKHLKMSMRKEILTVYHESLRLQGQKRGVTTGKERETRWTQPSSSNQTGNALNAAVVADNMAKKVSTNFIQVRLD